MNRKSRRKRGLPTAASIQSSTETTTILVDNSHLPVVREIARIIPNSVIVTKKDLGFEVDPGDEVLIPAFCETSTTSFGAAAMKVISKDHGKGDGRMPVVVQQQRQLGYNLTLVLYPEQLTEAVATMSVRAVANRYRKIFMRKDADIIHIAPLTNGVRVEMGRAGLSRTWTKDIKSSWIF